MLVLSRRVGDAVLIAGDIRVVVLGVDGRGVRLGIEAPDDVSILREEIVLEIADENRRASANARQWAAALAPRPAAPEAEGGGAG